MLDDSTLLFWIALVYMDSMTVTEKQRTSGMEVKTRPHGPLAPALLFIKTILAVILTLTSFPA